MQPLPKFSSMVEDDIASLLEPIFEILAQIFNCSDKTSKLKTESAGFLLAGEPFRWSSANLRP